MQATAIKNPPPPAKLSLINPVVLQYKGASSFIITGKITGNTYLFAAHDTGLSVDERDVPALLEAAELLCRASDV